MPQLGPDVGKNWGYNFVSFDPRGIRFSGPTISCGSTNDTTTLTRRQLDDFSEQTILETFQYRAALNKACADANKDTDAKYIGTVAVVQDMMHFVELQAAAKGQNPKNAKINFYGVSYGTVVGQTLAALYPDRLNRVLLDANVFGVGWYQGWYPTSLDDLAHSFWMFAKLCFEAGPELCELAKGMKSIDEVKARIDGQLTNTTYPTFASDYIASTLSGWFYNPTLNATQGGYRTVVEALMAGEKGVEYPQPQGEETDAFSANAQVLVTAVDIAGRYPWKTYEDWRAATDRLRSTAPYGPIMLSLRNG